MKIGEVFETIKTRQILTSRGEPTVEIELHTSLGVYRTSCPSGASTGSKEAKVILDKKEDFYRGKSIKKAIFNIKTLILPRIQEMNDIEIWDQEKIDKMLIHLDGTENKSRIGANAILPISMAFCRAGAAAKQKSLREHIKSLSKTSKDLKKFPIPYFNVLNGGVHGGNTLPFQEIMVSFHTNEYDTNLESGAVFYMFLKEVIIDKYGICAIGLGDEGGFAPPVKTLDEALDLILETEKRSNLKNMEIAIDCAASEFYKDGKYDLSFKNEESGYNEILTTEELCDFYLRILKKYKKVKIVEDPFDENDFEGWKRLMIQIKKEENEIGKIDVVGDDLTVTNIKYIEKAVEENLCNTLLVKLNQVGTVFETIESVKMARKAGMKIMVSHRSGETEDTFIADFAAGLYSDFIKSGAPCRGERVAKYNQLLRIYESLKKKGEL